MSSRPPRRTGTLGWPLRLTLPIPPSLNDIYRRNPNGKGVYLIPIAKTYKLEIKAELQRYMDLLGAAPSASQISMMVWVFWPNRSQSRDTANLEKLLCDAMKGVVFDDDCQIFIQFRPPHHCDKEHPRLEILLTEWDGEDDAPPYEGYTTTGLARYADIQVQRAEAIKAGGIAQGKLTRRINKALAAQSGAVSRSKKVTGKA